MKISQLIQEWIHIKPSYRTQVLASQDYSATTGANFLGTDNSDPGSVGENIYSNPQNLPTAISSILNHTQNRANFHPASTSPEELSKYYGQYIEEIDRTPFLHIQMNDRKGGSFNSSDYNKLIDEVVNLYQGVSSEDKDKIASSIADMGKAVFSQSSSERWANLFSQATIDYSNIREPKFFIYYTSLYMKKADHGKDGVEEHQSYTVNRAEYKVLAELIHAHASSLAGLDRKSVDDWMNLSSTPERENAKLCFKVPKYSV